MEVLQKLLSCVTDWGRKLVLASRKDKPKRHLRSHTSYYHISIQVTYTGTQLTMTDNWWQFHT